MYMLSWKPSGISGWDWLWIFLGLVLDVMHWAQTASQRKAIPGYPGGAPGGVPLTPSPESEPRQMEES